MATKPNNSGIASSQQGGTEKEQAANSTGHTPGPWAWGVYGKKTFGVGRPGADGGGAFFLLRCTNDSTDSAAARADASIMAAAPLMELVLRAISYGVVRLVRSEHVPTLLEFAFDGLRMIVGNERGELSMSKLAWCVEHFGWAKIEAAIAKAAGKDGGQP